MYYLETNAVIALTKKKITLPDNIARQSYTSIYSIQEIFKNIEKKISDDIEVEKIVNSIKWINESGINIDWETYDQKASSAFGLFHHNPFAEILHEMYLQIFSNENWKEIISNPESIELFQNNNDQLKNINRDLSKKLQSIVKNSETYTLYSAEERNYLSEFTANITKELNHSLFIHTMVQSVLLFQEIYPTPEEIQYILSFYNGSLDMYQAVFNSFLNNILLMDKEIRHNDTVDIGHMIYVPNKSCKLITNDKNFRKLVRKSLGARSVMSVSQFLKKIEESK